MKAKRIITIALAVILAAMSVVSASAAVQLTEDSPSGNTEVKAKIVGNPGEVSYIISIPDVVDFGTLEIPADDSQDYDRDVTYDVEATQIDGLNTEAQAVAVYVKADGSSAEDRNFYIANKENASIKFAYDVYRSAGEGNVDESTNVNHGDYFTNGYYLTSFKTTGEILNGTLRFHQKQLYGQNIADIAGDYSGYMVFFSTIEDI